VFDRSVVIASLLFFSVGDVAASAIGMKYGRVKILNKTLEGSLACLAACLIAGYSLLYLGLMMSRTIIFAGALAATVAEAVSFRIDDNLTMPLVSGLVMTLMMI
jgi:dolichol kinase